MPEPQVDAGYRTVTCRDELATLASSLAGAPWIALDSESNSMFAYRERVCLIQLNAGQGLVLVDPLASAEGLDDLEPLRCVLEDATTPLYLHGGEYDVAVFKREYGISLQGVFDTQQAASFLGWEKTSYAAVVERILDVSLSKAFRDYDWATRPLDPGAIEYALADVRYLPDVAAYLQAEIERADLVEELELANEAVTSTPVHDNRFDPEQVHQVKGQQELSPEQRGRLRALLIWRDDVARELDRPPGRLINDRALVALIKADPHTRKQLSAQRLNSRIMRCSDSLLETLERTRKQGSEIQPLPAPPRPDRSTQTRLDKLRQWRRSEAERRGVPLQVVLPARALDALAHDPTADFDGVPQLGRKRVALYGEALREICSRG